MPNDQEQFMKLLSQCSFSVGGKPTKEMMKSRLGELHGMRNLDFGTHYTFGGKPPLPFSSLSDEHDVKVYRHLPPEGSKKFVFVISSDIHKPSGFTGWVQTKFGKNNHYIDFSLLGDRRLGHDERFAGMTLRIVADKQTFSDLAGLLKKNPQIATEYYSKLFKAQFKYEIPKSHLEDIKIEL